MSEVPLYTRDCDLCYGPAVELWGVESGRRVPGSGFRVRQYTPVFCRDLRWGFGMNVSLKIYRMSGFGVSTRVLSADLRACGCQGLGLEEDAYGGTSLTRKRTPLGPYRRPMLRVLGGS